MPALIIRPSIWWSSDAGPNVATIFVRLRMAAIIAQLIAGRCYQSVAMTFGQILVRLCCRLETDVIDDTLA